MFSKKRVQLEFGFLAKFFSSPQVFSVHSDTCLSRDCRVVRAVTCGLPQSICWICEQGKTEAGHHPAVAYDISNSLGLGLNKRNHNRGWVWNI